MGPIRFKPYIDAVAGAFGGDVDYAQVIKLYGKEYDETKYSPPKCVGIHKRCVEGCPYMGKASTSYVERSNLSLRMGVRRSTRLTNAFSKRADKHAAMVNLYYTFYNFCRIHKTLRVTPAMEAGLTDHVYDIEWIVSLIDERAPKRSCPKTYKKRAKI